MARLFLSTDESAPVATISKTGVIDVLKKCLIDGYGSKRPVGGWTMPHCSADNSIACFRNDHDNGATGMFLQLNGNRSDGWTARGYEDMTGVEEGVGPFPSQRGTTFYTGVNTWVLLATNKWVAIFFPAGGFWFGDIDAISPDDAYRCMLAIVVNNASWGFGSSNDSPLGTSTNNVGSGSLGSYWYYNNYCFPRRMNGTGAALGHLAYLPHPQYGQAAGSTGPGYTADGPLLVARMSLNNAAANTLRGWVPDMLAPLHPKPFQHLERVAIGDETYVAVSFCVRSSGTAQALFKLDAGE